MNGIYWVRRLDGLLRAYCSLQLQSVSPLLLSTLILVACSAKDREFVSGFGDEETSTSQGGSVNEPDLSPADGTVDGGDAVEQLSDLPLASDGLMPSEPDDCLNCVPLSALGQLCTNGADCSSGFCAPDIDNVQRCCDRACGDLSCERCSAEGVCGAVPSFAAECSEVSCPTDDVCRDFAQAIAAGTCSEAGQCAAVADCTFEWSSVARGGEACDCADSVCALKAAEPCTRNEDCAGSACRATAAGASVCCTQPCGLGQVCRADASGCEPEPVCTDGQVRCSSSSYQQCMGGQWVTQRECGALGCDIALGGCRRSAGDACTTTSDCGEGACRQAVGGARICCTAACDTACKLCTATGTGCQLLADDAACGAIQCPGDTTCRDFPNSVTTNRCIAGNCGNPAEICPGTPRNSGQSCSNTTLCDSSGNCSVSKKSLGTTCGNGAECLSGQCVDGVCCENSCNGPCMACRAGTGRCDLVPADDDACRDVSCDLDPECATAPVASITSNLCRAFGQCKTVEDCRITDFRARTPCDGATGHRFCDGQGSCVDPTVSCGQSSCAVSTETVCCLRQAVDESVSMTCEAASTCVLTAFRPLPSRTPVTCDEPSDCREGTVCCLQAASAGSGVRCVAPATCNRRTPFIIEREVCGSPRFVGTCPVGVPCILAAGVGLPGWSICEVP